MAPVSYTHLDVYKRQGLEQVDGLNAGLEDLGLGGELVKARGGMVNRVCLLYTSRCV